jgi:hypothetical protein
VEIVVVEAKKAAAKEVHKVKKLAKLVAAIERGSAKKLPKMPKGKRETNYGCLNPESGEGGASILRESSKGEASKDIIKMVEHLQSSFDSSKLNEEEEENLKVVNIPKKPIKASKWTKIAKEALEAQVAQMAQEAQTTKEAWEVKLQLEAKEIFQVTRKATWSEMELEWTKFKAFQIEEGPSSLSMNAMAKAIKVLQTLVVSKRETNM